jgi:RNA polymerase sigma factor (TIGR02999 family)
MRARCALRAAMWSARLDDSASDMKALAATLAAAESGDAAAASRLFAALYDELRRLAKRQLSAHGRNVSLSATTLLHEAYLDISGRSAVFQDRARFFGYAARAMRGLIIDHVRERRALKRGGEFQLTSLDTLAGDDVVQEQELVPLSDAIDDLAAVEPVLAELVELKFFCGFSFAEIAQMRGVSERSVQREWSKARLYLDRALRAD